MAGIYRYRRKRVRQARSHRGQTVRTRIRGLLTFLVVGTILSIVAVCAAAFGVYRSYANDAKPPQQAIAEASVGTSLAFDRSGQTKLYEYVDPLGGLRDPKPLAEISPYLIGATIATEDASFFDNPGVNFRGLARAGWENLTPFGPGFLSGSGGSSITQQLVKNVYLGRAAYLLAVSREESFDQKVERKVQETAIAIELKRKYDDHQILEWYLNQIDYANLAFGAEAAARRYFGKSAKDLTLGESALLAGLPQAPGRYTPAIEGNRELAKERQLQVLDLMINHLAEINRIEVKGQPGTLMHQFTIEEIEAAKQEPLNYVITSFPIEAPHFVFFVQDQVTRMCTAGLFEAPGDIPCDKVVTRGGLRITTTLDLGLQALGETIVEEEIASSEARYLGSDGSLIAIRPGTGEILTYVGSRDYFRDDIAGQVDIATSAQSHGSTMKVFSYLTAFEQGWVPSTHIDDKPLFLEGAEGKKQVNNWNFSHLGTITVRKAMSESVNTAAVRTVQAVGIDEMRDTSHKLGITDLRQGDCGPTITLGACEVQLVDMTFAFSVLANNGVMKGRPVSEDLPSGYRQLDPVSVLKIQDAEGNVIYQYSTPEQKQVVDPASAFMVTDVLSHEAINWSRLTLNDRPAAVKTGTSEEFRDGVVMGYTPDLSVGVWMGNADNRPMAPGTFSSAGTGPIWRRFMNEAHAYLQLPPKPFEKPTNIAVSNCGAIQEVFNADRVPSKPGACRAPAPRLKPGEATPPPTARPPVFPQRTIPVVTPTPEPTASPQSTASPKPTAPPGPSTSPVGFYYTVQEGDTLSSIAQEFGITTQELADANNLHPEDFIIPGDELFIPLAPTPEP